MLRLAIFIIVAATLLGALMPSGPTRTEDGSGETVRVASLGGNGGRPARKSQSGSGMVTLERSYDGHFYADAEVNGATVHFLVDTGASGIALSADDARKAGLDFETDEAEVIGSGASGQVWGHFVRLDRVELGLKTVHETDAVVLAGGDRSLLGQSFLSQFDSVEVRGDTMVLR